MSTKGILVGSLLGGLLASVCCIGPLVLSVLGLGSLGFAAGLAPLRPWFLGLTALLLTVGFYLAYRPRSVEACAPDQTCAKPASRTPQRIALWTVTTLAVALAAYPSWGTRRAAPLALATAGHAENVDVVLDVQGMTCTGCAAEIERELGRVPGVVRAAVSFERRRAEIALTAAHPEVEPLVAAVDKAGYRATEAAVVKRK